MADLNYKKVKSALREALGEKRAKKLRTVAEIVGEDAQAASEALSPGTKKVVEAGEKLKDVVEDHPSLGEAMMRGGPAAQKASAVVSPAAAGAEAAMRLVERFPEAEPVLEALRAGNREAAQRVLSTLPEGLRMRLVPLLATGDDVTFTGPTTDMGPLV